MRAFFITLCLGALLAGPARAAEQRLVARVDARVELMSLIFRLAGNPEYNQPNSKSSYLDDVEQHFAPFRSHAVVSQARHLRETRGVSFDAVMSLAVHLTDVTELREKIPVVQKPARLDGRWPADELPVFLRQAREFVRDSGFARFYAEHEKYYAAAADRLSAELARRDYLAWFDRYFGTKPQARFEVFVGLLNGGGCYGVGVRYPDGREEICPVIGAGLFGADGLPVFGSGVESTVAHELCHTYTNPLVDQYAARLEPAGARIYPYCAATLRAQAYGNWKTMMYESLVRACVVRYLLAASGATAAQEAVRSDQGRGFEWVGDLSRLLGQFEQDRARYPSFAEFMPQMVAFFDQYAGEYERRAMAAPKVVSMLPANGATEVDPALTEIKIVFDRPMRDQAWSVVGGGPHFPELIGKPAYDAARQVLTLPVRLKPNWSYEFWLNRGQFDSFQSEDGHRLAPVPVTFRTRPSEP